jgi:putative hydrolase of the HAD superfamily
VVSSAPTVKAVVFDLGGVLAEVSGVASLRAMAGIDSDEALWHRWLSCDWVRAFERGRCSPEDFAAGVVSDWGLSIDPADFLAEFSGWVNRPYDGADELVAAVAGRCTVGCLSNMNAVHWETTISHWPFVARFDHVFLSYRIGAVKPDREIYDHVIAALGVAPEQILFVDDNQLNVDGAVDAGIRAYRTKGVGDARAVIERALG